MHKPLEGRNEKKKGTNSTVDRFLDDGVDGLVVC